MSKLIRYSLVAVALVVGGCTTNKDTSPKSYDTDNTRAMPEQTYWWEGK